MGGPKGYAGFKSIWIETRRKCFVFLLDNPATEKKTTWPTLIVNSFYSRHHVKSNYSRILVGSHL